MLLSISHIIWHFWSNISANHVGKNAINASSLISCFVLYYIRYESFPILFFPIIRIWNNHLNAWSQLVFILLEVVETLGGGSDCREVGLWQYHSDTVTHPQQTPLFPFQSENLLSSWLSVSEWTSRQWNRPWWSETSKARNRNSGFLSSCCLWPSFLHCHGKSS